MTFTLHVWCASYIFEPIRIKLLKYALLSLFKQTRKPDSVWLSIYTSNIYELKKDVECVLEELQNYKKNIAFYILNQRERLLQFEHYYYIHQEFIKQPYTNSFITFMDDDDLSALSRLQLFEEIPRKEYFTLYQFDLQIFHDNDENSIATEYDNILNRCTKLENYNEYFTLFCPLYTLNIYFDTINSKALQLLKGLADTLFKGWMVHNFKTIRIKKPVVAYRRNFFLHHSYSRKES